MNFYHMHIRQSTLSTPGSLFTDGFARANHCLYFPDQCGTITVLYLPQFSSVTPEELDPTTILAMVVSTAMDPTIIGPHTIFGFQLLSGSVPNLWHDEALCSLVLVRIFHGSMFYGSMFSSPCFMAPCFLLHVSWLHVFLLHVG